MRFSEDFGSEFTETAWRAGEGLGAEAEVSTAPHKNGTAHSSLMSATGEKLAKKAPNRAFCVYSPGSLTFWWPS